MLKEHDQFFRRIVIILDCFVIGSASFGAYILINNLSYFCPSIVELQPNLPLYNKYAWMIVIIVPLWLISLSYFKMYKSMREKSILDLFWIIFEASLLAILMLSAIDFFFNLGILSRAFIIILFTSIVVMLSIERLCILAFLQYIRQSGYNYRALLVVGSGDRANNFARMIESHPHWGLKIVGFIDEENKIGLKVGKSKVMGSFKDLAKILDENIVSEVVFILPRKWLAQLEDYIKICEKVGVKATIAVDFFNTSIAKPIVTELNGLPLLTLDTTPVDEFQLFLKRIIDIVIASIALILSLPVFIVYSVALKLTSPGPILFKQKRCGLYGRIFTLYKFRTMVVDADKMLDKVKDFNESDGPIFHSRSDPRVIPLGRVLRKTSLDELPQLINVLKGDMSVIGPRPPLPEEVMEYERWQRRRLSLRPGIVCTWQVTRRFQPDFQKWMKMDMDYIDNWSLGLDFGILLKIFPAILKGFMHWHTESGKK